jgi:hypothetical protein
MACASSASRLVQRRYKVYRETYHLAFIRGFRARATTDLLAKNIDLETVADRIIGALMHRLLKFPPGKNSISEFRDHMIKLLRQAGFDVSEA